MRWTIKTQLNLSESTLKKKRIAAETKFDT